MNDRIADVLDIERWLRSDGTIRLLHSFGERTHSHLVPIGDLVFVNGKLIEQPDGCMGRDAEPGMDPA